MDRDAEDTGHTAVICAGWDPGTFSLARIYADAFIPGANHYTFWGPGVSQGHTNAIKGIEGVIDALQLTMPIESAVERVKRGENPGLTTSEKHWRDCYVVAKKEYEERIRNLIKTMPNYYADYSTEVTFVSQKRMNELKIKMPHAGSVISSGITGQDNKAVIEYHNEWASNPEATGNILVACARACHRLNAREEIGAFTMADIPPALLSPHSRDELLKQWM